MSYTGVTMAGDGSNPPENDNSAADQQEDQQSTATEQSAYVAPTDGQPTICSNCHHFDGQGSCDQPEVIADPEVQGKVDPNGHSKFYSPKSGEAAEGMGGMGGMMKPKQSSPGIAGLGAGAKFPRSGNTQNF